MKRIIILMASLALALVATSSAGAKCWWPLGVFYTEKLVGQGMLVIYEDDNEEDFVTRFAWASTAPVLDGLPLIISGSVHFNPEDIYLPFRMILDSPPLGFDVEFERLNGECYLHFTEEHLSTELRIRTDRVADS